MLPAAMQRRLDATAEKFALRAGADWALSAPSLEDVFIDLMSRSRENFQ